MPPWVRLRTRRFGGSSAGDFICEDEAFVAERFCAEGAMERVGDLSRHGPFELRAVSRAAVAATPRRFGSASRLRSVLHCLHCALRKRRPIRLSRSPVSRRCHPVEHSWNDEGAFAPIRLRDWRPRRRLEPIAILDKLARDPRPALGQEFRRLREGAVVGAIDEARAAALVDQAFADLPASGDLNAVAEAPFAGLGGVEIVDLDVPQSTIRFGRPAVPRQDPDHIASIVLAHILGGAGLSSRLFREVREKRGLAYSVSASISALDRASYLYGGGATKNERAGKSLAVIGGQVLDMAHGGLSEDELEKGKKYLVGSYPLRFDFSAKIAGQLVQIQLEGHGPSWLVERNAKIAAVTMADARRVAERVFGDGALSVVLVGRPARV